MPSALLGTGPRGLLGNPAAALPAITLVNPPSTTVGQNVVITLENMPAGWTLDDVRFGATSSAGEMKDSDTQVTAVAPAGSGTVDISVDYNSGETVTAIAAFTYA